MLLLFCGLLSAESQTLLCRSRLVCACACVSVHVCICYRVQQPNTLCSCRQGLAADVSGMGVRECRRGRATRATTSTTNARRRKGRTLMNASSTRRLTGPSAQGTGWTPGMSSGKRERGLGATRTLDSCLLTRPCTPCDSASAGRLHRESSCSVPASGYVLQSAVAGVCSSLSEVHQCVISLL